MKVAISDNFSMGTWRHTVLELFALDGPWPTEGEPSEWIEKNLVAYAQGEDKTVVVFTPTYLIVAWKMAWWAEELWGFIQNLWYRYTPWGRHRSYELEKWFLSLPVVSDDNLLTSDETGVDSDEEAGGSQ